jgi:hypothetical protein
LARHKALTGPGRDAYCRLFDEDGSSSAGGSSGSGGGGDSSSSRSGGGSSSNSGSSNDVSSGNVAGGGGSVEVRRSLSLELDKISKSPLDTIMLDLMMYDSEELFTESLNLLRENCATSSRATRRGG